MTHQDAIEQAIQRQLEIERKAAAWDFLILHLEEQGNEKGNTDAQALLNWVQQLQEATRA